MIEKDSWLNDSLRIEVHNLVHLFNCLYRKAYVRLLNLKNFGSYDSRAFKEMFIDCSLLLLFFFFFVFVCFGFKIVWIPDMGSFGHFESFMSFTLLLERPSSAFFKGDFWQKKNIGTHPVCKNWSPLRRMLTSLYTIDEIKYTLFFVQFWREKLNYRIIIFLCRSLSDI